MDCLRSSRSASGQMSVPGVELYVLQQIPKGVGYFFVLPGLRRALLRKKALEEEFICKKAILFFLIPVRTPTFFTRLAHGVSPLAGKAGLTNSESMILRR